MTYTFTVIQSNGAIILRSSIDQDDKSNAKHMLDSVKKKFPEAKFCMAFRTFDGDCIIQFEISDKHQLKHESKLVF